MASACARKFIAATTVGPQIPGSGNAPNLIADVVIQDFKLRERAVLMFKHGAKLCLFSSAWLAWSSRRTWLIRQGERDIPNEEMFIMADGPQIASERISEIVTIDNGIIVAVLLMIMDCQGHLNGHIRIHVVVGQSVADSINGLLSSASSSSMSSSFAPGGMARMLSW